MAGGNGSMWRKSGGTLTALCVTVAIGLTMARCGGTGSDLEGLPEGGQFVDEACSPEDSCLKVTLNPRRMPADGVSEASMLAELRNADGAPAGGEEICFTVEDPNVVTIVEPTGAGCQLTDGNGQLSARIRAGTLPVSVRIIARNFARDLETNALLVLTDPGQLATGLQVTAVPGILRAANGAFPGEASLITARLTDQDGSPISGEVVQFTRSPATGSLSSSTAITGADGIATVVFTAGSEGANVTIFARVDGEEATTVVQILERTPTPTPTNTPTPTPTATVAPVCKGAGVACTSSDECCSNQCSEQLTPDEMDPPATTEVVCE